MSTAAVAAPADVQPVAKAEGRMLALDVLRGFTMFWIIGSDSLDRAFEAIEKGSSSPTMQSIGAFLSKQFSHPSWEGFVFYDSIFPMFIFIIGVSLVYSLQKIVATEGKAVAYRRVINRFILMYLLGVFYDEGMAKLYEMKDGVLQWDENMLCGVLQRLALCYFFTSLLFLNLRLKGLVAVFVAINVIYSGMLFFVKSPDQPELSWKRGENIIHYIEKQIPPYHGTDPEALASTPPAITTCLLGVFVAFFLQNKKYTLKNKAAYLFATGLVLAIVALLWGHYGGYPIIKRLWTTTYVLLGGGFSMMMLGAFIYLIDILKVQWWTPMFMWIGMNPLTIYMSVNILDYEALARRFVGGPIEEAVKPYGLLLVSVVSLALSVWVVRYMYYKKIFLRL